MSSAAAPPATVPAPKRRSLGLLLAVLLVAPCLMSLGVAFVVKTYVIQAFFIPSPAMEPTLQVDDRVLVNRLAKSVKRGDIVVFERLPDDQAAIKDLIKRVVAVGGDTIESKGATLFVNDQAVVEPYVKTSSTIGNPVLRRTIPPDHVYVMGDNRTNSADSRVFGPVHEDRIVGRAFLKIWPSIEGL